MLKLCRLNFTSWLLHFLSGLHWKVGEFAYLTLTIHALFVSHTRFLSLALRGCSVRQACVVLVIHYEGKILVCLTQTHLPICQTWTDHPKRQQVKKQRIRNHSLGVFGLPHCVKEESFLLFRFTFCFSLLFSSGQSAHITFEILSHTGLNCFSNLCISFTLKCHGFFVRHSPPFLEKPNAVSAYFLSLYFRIILPPAHIFAIICLSFSPVAFW